MNLQQQIDALYEIREELRQNLEAEKEIRARYEALEAQLMHRLDEVGTSAARGTTASVSITESEVATVEDWSALHEYIQETGGFHLLQRRINSKAAIDEMGESEGGNVPGLSRMSLRKLGLRKL